MLGVLELYCGIGGIATVLGEAVPAAAATVVAAVDIDGECLEIYRHNFAHPTVRAAVESLPARRLRAWDADLWWLSPPCQPYTRRGRRRDLDDPRARSFPVVLERIAALRPRYLALENVPGFETSAARGALVSTLAAAGYGEIRERLLCPSELGWPNRRRRYYLLAARERLAPSGVGTLPRRRLDELIAASPPEGEAERPGLTLDPAIATAYRHALDVVDRRDPAAVTACFTAAYGRSVIRSGSYLRIGPTDDGQGEAAALRRFSPREVLRLLGFPAGYRLPPGLPAARAWRRVGNSLALPAVRRVLAQLPELAPYLRSPTHSSEETSR